MKQTLTVLTALLLAPLAALRAADAPIKNPSVLIDPKPANVTAKRAEASPKEPAKATSSASPSNSERVIVNEDFSQPDAIAKWRWGAGKWTVADGVLKGTETAERKHAAGLACQRTYHDAEIHFRFQFAGGSTAMLLLRNKFGNLCRVTITKTGMTLTKDKPNLPADTKERSVVLAKATLKLKPGEWYAVTATVQGEDFTATLHDHTALKGRHPAINVDKTEIEFLAGGDSILFDDLKASVPGPR